MLSSNPRLPQILFAPSVYRIRLQEKTDDIAYVFSSLSQLGYLKRFFVSKSQRMSDVN